MASREQVQADLLNIGIKNKDKFDQDEFRSRAYDYVAQTGALTIDETDAIIDRVYSGGAGKPKFRFRGEEVTEEQARSYVKDFGIDASEIEISTPSGAFQDKSTTASPVNPEDFGTGSLRQQFETLRQLESELGNYRNLISEYTSDRGPIQLVGREAAEISSANASIMFLIAQASGTGALQEADRKVVEDILVNPTNLGGAFKTLTRGGRDGNLASIDQAQKTFKSRLNSLTGQSNEDPLITAAKADPTSQEAKLVEKLIADGKLSETSLTGSGEAGAEALDNPSQQRRREAVASMVEPRGVTGITDEDFDDANIIARTGRFLSMDSFGEGIGLAMFRWTKEGRELEKRVEAGDQAAIEQYAALYDTDAPGAKQIVASAALTGVNAVAGGILKGGQAVKGAAGKSFSAIRNTLGGINKKGAATIGAVEGGLGSVEDGNDLFSYETALSTGLGAGLGVGVKVGLDRAMQHLMTRKMARESLQELAEKAVRGGDDETGEALTATDVERQIEVEENFEQQMVDIAQNGTLSDKRLSGYKIQESPDGTVKVVRDRVAEKAEKLGIAPSHVALLNNASDADQSDLRGALAYMRRKQQDPNTGVKEGVDIYAPAGQRIAAQEKYINDRMSESFKELDKIAEGLKDEPLPDITGIGQKIDDDMSSNEMSFDDNGNITFIGSDLDGASPKAMNLVYEKIIKARNAHDLHKIKRFIDKQISTGLGTQTLTGDVKGILSGWRRSIDDTLDKQYLDYNNVNKTLHSGYKAKEALMSAVGKSFNDIADPYKDIRLGKLAMQFLTDNVAAPKAMTAVSTIQDTAEAMGMKIEGDTINLVNGLYAIREAFPEVKVEGLAGKVKKGIVDADAAAGVAGAAADVATGVPLRSGLALGRRAIKFFTRKNADGFYEKQQEAIENLLKDRDVKKGALGRAAGAAGSAASKIKEQAGKKTLKGHINFGADRIGNDEVLSKPGITDEKVTEFSRIMDSDQIQTLKNYAATKADGGLPSLRESQKVADIIDQFDPGEKATDAEIDTLAERLADERNTDIQENIDEAAPGGDDVPVTDKNGSNLEDQQGRTPQVDEDGYITLYHSTSRDAANKIIEEGFGEGSERGKVFFSTSRERTLEASPNTGEVVLSAKVKPDTVEIDDAFDDAIDVQGNYQEINDSSKDIAIVEEVSEEITDEIKIDGINEELDQFTAAQERFEAKQVDADYKKKVKKITFDLAGLQKPLDFFESKPKMNDFEKEVLKNTTFRFTTAISDGTNGRYSAHTNKISLNRKMYKPDFDSVLYHEIGHSIDYNRSGVAQGMGLLKIIDNGMEFVENKNVSLLSSKPEFIEAMKSNTENGHDEMTNILGNRIRRITRNTEKISDIEDNAEIIKAYDDLGGRSNRKFMRYLKSYKEMFADAYGQYRTNENFSEYAPKMAEYFENIDKQKIPENSEISKESLTRDRNELLVFASKFSDRISKSTQEIIDKSVDNYNQLIKEL